MNHVTLEINAPVATATLDDHARRNALSEPMFDALDAALAEVAHRDDVVVLMLCGEGKVFCAGFDLAAAVGEPPQMAVFIRRLGAVLARLRGLPQVVVAAVQGAAIAGGCALVSACDLAVVSATATLGYPVHRLGVSPAVTIPTLQQAIGAGRARALLLGGELIDGRQAHRIGLASHLSRDDASVMTDAAALCGTIAGHGRLALRRTKAWLNELDGTADPRSFEGPAAASAAIATHDEAIRLLRERWKR